MGLDVSHDAFSGAYSAFNRFRQAVCAATGGSFPPHRQKVLPSGQVLGDDWLYVGEGYNSEDHPGLWEFLTHSDCDGEIAPETCRLVADDLEALLPKIEALDGFGGGHIERGGGLAEVTRKFIRGCRAAAEAGEPLEFF